jgi:FMN phosphatase YigB (HAD superfamily)
MIKAIIFDNFGVLVGSNEENVFPAIRLALKNETLSQKFKKVYLAKMDQTDLGKISADDFFELIAQKIGIPGEGLRFRKIAYSSFQERAGMLGLARRIKNDYELAIITDAPKIFREYAKNWPVVAEFEPQKIFISSEIGMTKKNPKLFEYVLKKLNLNPGEAIFIDDNEDNIRVANSVGINTIRFETPEKLKKELKSLLK